MKKSQFALQYLHYKNGFKIIYCQRGHKTAFADSDRQIGNLRSPDALIEEALKVSFSLGQHSPEGAYPWSQGLSDLFELYNVRLAGVGAPQFETPTYERRMELFAKYEADAELAMSDEARKAIKKWAHRNGWKAEFDLRIRPLAVHVTKTMSAALDTAAQLKAASSSDTDDRQ